MGMMLLQVYRVSSQAVLVSERSQSRAVRPGATWGSLGLGLLLIRAAIVPCCMSIVMIQATTPASSLSSFRSQQRDINYTEK